MNRYAAMKRRHQEEVHALPLGFAYSDRQFIEMMRGWGLDPDKDTDKIYRLPGGGFVRKKDHALLHGTLDRHDAELKAAIAADTTGEGFIYEMFVSELRDHEYSYTMDVEETLDALGYTAEDIRADGRLARGLAKAQQAILGRQA